MLLKKTNFRNVSKNNCIVETSFNNVIKITILQKLVYVI